MFQALPHPEDRRGGGAGCALTRRVRQRGRVGQGTLCTPDSNQGGRARAADDLRSSRSSSTDQRAGGGAAMLGEGARSSPSRTRRPACLTSGPCRRPMRPQGPPSRHPPKPRSQGSGFPPLSPGQVLSNHAPNLCRSPPTSEVSGKRKQKREKRTRSDSAGLPSASSWSRGKMA